MASSVMLLTVTYNTSPKKSQVKDLIQSATKWRLIGYNLSDADAVQ